MINLILNILQKSKALNIIILERNIGFTEKNKIIISTGTSLVHINSITKNLIIFLKKNFENIIYTKSGMNTEWVLIEIEDVIINIMSKDARHYYDLESLYTMIEHDK
ncbi:MAG TPA: ribosome silencing factor [Candidatus Azoamicus sp.]